MNNVPNIRDIYIPDSVSIFPIAYGWWIIVAGIISLFLFFKFFIWGYRKSRKAYIKSRLKKIDLENPVYSAIEMSNLLRRICKIKYKEASVLYGAEWTDFLNSHCSKKINGKVAELLVYAPFIDKKNDKYNTDIAKELKSFCYSWIGENL